MSSNTARAFSSCLVTTASVAARAFVGPAAAPVAVALEGCCGGLEGAWESNRFIITMTAMTKTMAIPISQRGVGFMHRPNARGSPVHIWFILLTSPFHRTICVQADSTFHVQRARARHPIH